jgi:hypothetical protein
VDLTLLDGEFALARLDRDAEPPPLPPGNLAAIVRDDDAVTVVCRETDAPAAGETSRGWRALEVAGPLDLALTGVLAAIAAPLRDAGVPIFVLSSFATDFVLVPGARLDDATAALKVAGHKVTN